MPLISKTLSTADIRSLKDFLDSPKRPDGTLRFHELQGFLFAIASSPETISPSEWLPLIGNDQGLGFENEAEAQQQLNRIMALYNSVNTAVLKRSQALPQGCAFDKDLLANFDEQASISQWSRGFMIGHDWLSKVWDEYLIEEMEEECGATAMALSFFSSRRLGEAYFREFNPKSRKSAKAFEQYATTVRKLFPEALASYANMGRTLFEALSDQVAADKDRH